MANEDLEIMLLQKLLDGQDNIKEDISDIKIDIARNTDDLAEHMRRTDVLEKLHIDNTDRIEKLETPGKTRKQIIKWITTAGMIAGAIVAVAKVAGLF